MLVPAIALSWWLASLPMKSYHPVPTAPPTADPALAELAEETPESDPAIPEEPTVGSPEAPDPNAERVLYRGMITPEIARVAATFLDLPMGAERAATVEGHRFVFVLQRHYHPPGFKGAPNGWHKGVTVFEAR
jgi:hypothetical protein